MTARAGSNRGQSAPSRRSVLALDGLNFFLADVRTGVGPFLAVYLSSALHWDAARIGVALSAMSIGSLIAQTPAGALIDGTTGKRAIVLVGAILVGLSCEWMAFTQSFPLIVGLQAVAGIAADIFPPALAALTLGLVGRGALSQRIGRNEAFNHGGNVVAAVLAGVLATYLLETAVFHLTFVLAMASVLCVLLIKPHEIDHRLARGGDDADGQPSSLRDLLRDRRLLYFTLAVTFFHFANAAMLPQVGQELAEGKQGAPLYMAACVVVAQLVMIPTALLAGRLAATVGRKPVFLVGFAVLPLRGVLYTLTDNQYWLIAIQLLDGIGAGIFGVVSVLLVADLTRGTGRFNLTQGMLATAVGIGASLSNVVTGFVVTAGGYNAGFLTLAAVALTALAVFYFLVPETAPGETESASTSPRSG